MPGAGVRTFRLIQPCIPVTHYEYKPVEIPGEEEILIIPPGEILCIEAAARKCRVYHLHSKEPFVTSLNISEIEGILPQEIFCPVHRSFIVNVYHRKTMNKSRTRIFFPGGAVAHVSEAGLEKFLEKLSGPKVDS